LFLFPDISLAGFAVMGTTGPNSCCLLPGGACALSALDGVGVPCRKETERCAGGLRWGNDESELRGMIENRLGDFMRMFVPQDTLLQGTSSSARVVNRTRHRMFISGCIQCNSPCTILLPRVGFEGCRFKRQVSRTERGNGYNGHRRRGACGRGGVYVYQLSAKYKSKYRWGP